MVRLTEGPKPSGVRSRPPGFIPGGPLTFDESWEWLKIEEKLGQSPAPPVVDGRLPKDVLRFAHHVFQPRVEGLSLVESKEQVAKLVEGIKRNRGHRLDPVLVWFSGDGWYVVDGAHRMAAYSEVERAGWTSRSGTRVDMIPVTVLEGDLMDAHIASKADNNKDRLPVSVTSKLLGAWRLTVKVGRSRSRKDISLAAGVSTATIARMRKVLSEIQRDFPKENPLDLSWVDIQEWQRGGQSRPSGDWGTSVIRDYAERFYRVFGKIASKAPDQFARVLYRVDRMLPGKLAAAFEAMGMVEPDQGEGEDEGDNGASDETPRRG